MKTTYTFMACLLFVLCSYAQDPLGVTSTLTAEEITSPPPVAGPNLQLENEAIHFKSITVGETKKGALNIFNTGREALTIDNLSTSCTCITVNMPKKLLNTGDMSSLEYTFTPTRKGAYRETIYVGSNATPEVTIIEVRGVVE